MWHVFNLDDTRFFLQEQSFIEYMIKHLKLQELELGVKGCLADL